MTTNIEIKRISAHPNNPRKDLGDLTELIESIKANGVLQNLTVVPWVSSITNAPSDNQKTDPLFTVVIGHRRWAAALKAGLKEVPCVISDMNKITQISTMLTENIQRNDLTILEQAEGFQMMIDLGEPVKAVVEKSGFSETTVRDRLEILKLDRDIVQESIERDANITDYSKLKKIEDIKTRNKVLETIGTNNFDHTLKSAISQQEKAKKIKKWRDYLSRYAEEIEKIDYKLYSRIIDWDYGSLSPEDAEFPDDFEDGTEKYYFKVETWGRIYLYGDYVEKASEIDPLEAERKQKIAEKRAGLEEAEQIAFELRQSFIANVSNATAKKHYVDIAILIVENQYHGYGGIEEQILGEYLDVTFDSSIEDTAEQRKAFDNERELAVRANPYRALLFVAYLGLNDNSYANWRHGGLYHTLRSDVGKNLNQLYAFLVKLGYVMSDAEKALQDGTHKCYEQLEESQEAI